MRAARHFLKNIASITCCQSVSSGAANIMDAVWWEAAGTGRNSMYAWFPCLQRPGIVSWGVFSGFQEIWFSVGEACGFQCESWPSGHGIAEFGGFQRAEEQPWERSTSLMTMSNMTPPPSGENLLKSSFKDTFSWGRAGFCFTFYWHWLEFWHAVVIQIGALKLLF